MKCFLLGCVVMLLVGLVQAEETNEIAELRKKAEAGVADAQFNLGLKSAKGDGVPKDATEAVKWTRKAAEQGLAWAQFFLGFMYVSGEGVIKDMVEAHAWFNVAGALGNENAKKNLVKAKARMTKGQLAEATELARERLEKYRKKK